MKTLSTLVSCLSLAGLLQVPSAAQGAAQQNSARTGLVRVQLTPQEPRAVLKLPAPDVEVLAQQITFTAAPSGLAYDAKVGVQVTERPAGVATVRDTRSPASDLGKQALRRDIELYARASQRLAERGYRAESVRMREIVRELMFRLDPPSIAKRAAKLLAGNIQDRAVRVSIIELAAEGYAAGGWETNAEVLQWFASLGRGQLTDGATDRATEVLPMPEAANAGSGSVMDNLIELVLGAVGMHKQLGNEEAAKACMRLGRFYVEPGLGAFADGEGRVGVLVGPSIDRLRLIESADLGMEATATDVTSRLRGIGYVGGAEMGVDATATDVTSRLRGLGYVGGAETGLEAAAIDSTEPPSALDHGGDVEARDVLLEEHEHEAEPEPVEVPVLAVGTYRFVDPMDIAGVNQDPRSLKNLERSLGRLQAQLASLEAQLAEQRARLDAGKRKAKGGRSAR